MYKLIAIAGTFDRLHKGHRFFISQTFKFGEKVLIGLTSDNFAISKLKSQNSNLQLKSQNYQERKRQLEAYLKEEGYFGRSAIIKIGDVYGPAIDPPAGEAGNNEIEALVVTSDTYEGGRKVNEKRRTLGLTPLKLLQIPLIITDDHKRITSTRIRLGEIDRWGKVYLSNIKDQRSPARNATRSVAGGKIKEEVRKRLKKPIGLLIKGDSKDPYVIAPEIKKLVKQKSPVILITVGDVATKLCNEIGILPQLAVIDYKVGRVKLYNSLSDLAFPSLAKSDLARVRNPAGSITISLVNSVSKAMKNLVSTGKQQIIKVEGEEDLAGVPAILLSPLGSLIIYGQPGKGIVVVEVTEQKKEQVINILNP